MGKGATAVILAAGSSQRMGERNKLLELFEGKPLLLHVVEQALSSDCKKVGVVTGHENERIEQLLSGFDISLVHNDKHNTGMGSSLRYGIAFAKKAKSEGALILLGDMPKIDACAMNTIVSKAAHNPGYAIVATCEGKPRTPVYWPYLYFDEIMKINGDKGARDLIKSGLIKRIDVELGAKAGFDLDTPEAFEAGESD